jgi:CNT family concentrative nucleoside transporter
MNLLIILTSFGSIFRGLLGILILVGIGFLLSNNKKKINWITVISGLVLQLGIALCMLKSKFVRDFFYGVVGFFKTMIDSSTDSAQFLFGDLAVPGGPFGFAFFVLPTIVFFSALSSLLYYLGILQKVVYVFAWIMKKTMRLTGGESLAAAANVFIGQTEAPLVVKPYLNKMTKSEMMCLMTGGMATIAGGVFGAYMSMLGGNVEAEQLKFGMHLLTASIISAPAAIIMAKLLVPETENIEEAGNLKIPREDAGSNILDAITRGTTDGLKLAVNVAAMLLAFTAFIFLFNKVLMAFGGWTSLNETIIASTNGLYEGLSLQYIFGLLFSPLAWVIGAESGDILAVGQLLGEKTMLNEFFAYDTLAGMKAQGLMSEKSIIISTYALCGFANFASIGIQIGGIGSLVPGRMKMLSQLGVRSLIGGTLACLITAAIAGMFV